MNTINMPGFTAEASICPTSRHYQQMSQAPALAGGAVRPAVFVDHDCYTRCRSTCSGRHCYDLFGAARGACLRECTQDCLEACTRS